MSDSKVNITLLTTNKAGVLSSIMMKSKSFGLIFTGNKIERIDDDHSIISMTFDGKLMGTKQEFADHLKSQKNVLKVKNIYIEDLGLQLDTLSIDEMSVPIETAVEEEHDFENIITAESQPEEEKEEKDTSFEISDRFFL